MIPSFSPRLKHKSVIWRYVLLALIVLLGLHLRLEAVRYTVVAESVRADARDYLLYAVNLRLFNVYSRSDQAVLGKVDTPTPDALRSPGYPLFLSLFVDHSLSQVALLKITLTQAVIGAAMLLLIYVLFAKLLSPAWGLTVAMLAAISPHLVMVNVFLLTECLNAFLIMVFLWALSCWQQRVGLILPIVTGSLLALVTLVRPWSQYFVVPLILWLVMAKHLENPRRLALLFGLGFAIPMACWLGRNIITLGVVSDSTLTINTLHHGLYPWMIFDNFSESFGYPYRFDPRASEISASMTSVLTEILRRLVEAPFDYLGWVVVGKPIMLFSWNIFEGARDLYIYPVLKTPYDDLLLFKITRDMMALSHAVLTCLAGLGAGLAWLPWVARKFDANRCFLVRTISLFYVYFVVVHLIGAPFSRYSIPMRPVTYGLATFALCLILAMRFPGKTSGQTAQLSL